MSLSLSIFFLQQHCNDDQPTSLKMAGMVAGRHNINNVT